MRLDWIVLAPYAAIALGLSLCLYLFVSVKRDLRAMGERLGKKHLAFESEWKARSEQLDERWAELSQVSRLLVPPAPAASGLNLTKRSQALHLSRRGASSEEIAAALSLPRNEVELLIKVHRMTLGASPASAR
jgi:DNA-binding NarL/FixJ family response regulator